MLVESGGDNLTAVFSPALADVQIFVIDVAGGDDIPRKGGPGIARADLLVINKTDLAPYVGSDVERMLSDARARRGELPVCALSLVNPPHASPVATWIRTQLAAFAAARAPALERDRRAGPAPRAVALPPHAEAALMASRPHRRPPPAVAVLAIERSTPATGSPSCAADPPGPAHPRPLR